MTGFRVVAIIVAGGKGRRMQSDIPKQYLPIHGIPVLSYALLAFNQIEIIHEIILAVPSEDFEFCNQKIIDPFGFKKTIHLVPGGFERRDSVFNGLKFLRSSVVDSPPTIVLIHDGVRPLVDETVICSAIDHARRFGAAVPVIPVTDTLKKSGKDLKINQTIDREGIYLAQTPQAFRFEIIFNAYRHAGMHHRFGTDDAALVEQNGIDVVRFDGSKRNIKITTPEDMTLAAFYMRTS